MLIESPVEESEEDFSAFMLALVANIYGRVPDWFEFCVGRQAEYRGAFFRVFSCPAASVACQIQVRACQAGGLPRRIILQGTRNGIPSCTEISAGVEQGVDCADIRPV